MDFRSSASGPFAGIKQAYPLPFTLPLLFEPEQQYIFLSFNYPSAFSDSTLAELAELAAG